MRARILFFILFLCQLKPTLAQPAEKILLSTDKQWYYPGELIRLAVNTFNACGDTLAQLSSIAYVELVGADGKPVLQSKLKIDNAQGNGSMTVSDNMASGGYNVVAYTSWSKNFGASAFVRKPIYIVNPAKPATMNTSYSVPGEQAATNNTLRVETVKKVYGKREAVRANFTASNAARVLVSVYRIDGLEKGSDKIYMSELPNPCQATPAQPATFAFEKRGHMVLAKATNKHNQAPAGGVRGFLSSIEYPNDLFVATSDSSGTIRFEVGNIAGKTELVLQTDAATQKDYSIEHINPYADTIAASTIKGNDDVFESNAAVIDDAMMSAQIQKIFSGGDSLAERKDSGSAYPFYGKPDAYYLVSDYVRFSTVEEILREYVYTVVVQKRGGKLHPVIIDLLSKKPFTEAPLILVNGVPIHDEDQFMQMNADDFCSVAVVARKYLMGRQVFYGIIDVRMKTPLKEFPVNARVMDYEGTAIEKQLLWPDYGNEINRMSRKPDFRNVLYWNPMVKTDNNGSGSIEFYTSDLEGEYAIVVQTISKDGKVNSTKSSIEVR